MIINKAVIATAGYGTRRLPVTKAVEKSMMPILNRPVIDYTLTNVLEAGIKDIGIVVGPDQTQIRDYFANQSDVKEWLINRGKPELAVLADVLDDDVKITFIIQQLDRYGTTMPLDAARDFLEGERHFLYITGDDFLYREDDGSDLAELIDACQINQAEMGILGYEIDLSKFEVVNTMRLDGSNFIAIDEKVPVAEARSNMMNISRYVLSDKVWPYVEDNIATNQAEEFWVTDVITAAAKDHLIHCQAAKGRYLDSGNLDSWLEANNYLKKQLD